VKEIKLITSKTSYSKYHRKPEIKLRFFVEIIPQQKLFLKNTGCFFPKNIKKNFEI